MDETKSWDVLKTSQFIGHRVPKGSKILDMGAYASEILSILYRLGHSPLVGIDLNPQIRRMPYAGFISYLLSDFMHTPFKKSSFEVITSISTIEHGLNRTALLSEITRLLRPGGFFVASFDYWPDKIDTTGISLFGMEWTIFSRQEVLAFIQEAGEYGLMPCGKIDLHAQDRTIDYEGRRYTFAWMALRKEASLRQ
ncbi:MAG: class I SAM-dependent methyltransferase [Deltaproteobacteria bacterium]|nr:class I SAM-dependent methyltransferase [Deltaproteobacteria bacterium]